MRILIVEDDQLVWETMLDLVFKDKPSIIVAKDFKEAIHALNTNTFDAVALITDFNFPGGDGDLVADIAAVFGVKEIYLHSGEPSQAEEHKLYRRY